MNKVKLQDLKGKEILQSNSRRHGMVFVDQAMDRMWFE